MKRHTFCVSFATGLWCADCVKLKLIFWQPRFRYCNHKNVYTLKAFTQHFFYSFGHHVCCWANMANIAERNTPPLPLIPALLNNRVISYPTLSQLELKPVSITFAASSSSFMYCCLSETQFKRIWYLISKIHLIHLKLIMFAKEGTLRLRACSLDMQCDTPQPTPGRSFRKLTMYHVCVKFYLRCSGVDLANCTFIASLFIPFFFP